MGHLSVLGKGWEKTRLSGTSGKGIQGQELNYMRNKHRGFFPDYKGRIRQALIAGGLYKLARKGLGKGLFGLALPAVALLIEDLSNPHGMILPFFRWLLSRHGKVRVIEMSAKPLRKPSHGKAGDKG